MIAGTARARIAAVGDSTTAGLGSDGELFARSSTRSFPNQLAAYLRPRGLPARATSSFGEAGALGQFEASDGRFTLGDGWVIATNQPTFGGYPITNVTTTSPLVFRPYATADRVEFFDVPRPDGATVNVQVSGALAGIIRPPAQAPTMLRRSAFSFPRGTDPYISINATANGGVIGGFRLIGIDTYDSTHPDVAVWRMGASGSTTGFWLSSGYVGNPLDSLAALTPELTIINLGLNDLGQRVPAATYKANIREIVRRSNDVGDVILVVPNRINPAATPIALQRAYEQALVEVAAEFGAPLLNLPLVLGEYSDAARAGYYFDDVHLSGAGYAKVAAAIGDLVLAN